MNAFRRMIPRCRARRTARTERRPPRSPAARLAVVLSLAGVALMPVASPAGARADESADALDEYAPRVDAALDAALRFLGDRQAGYGALRDKHGRAEKDEEIPRGHRFEHVGPTALGVMAFLAKGHTPGAGRHGEAIERGIDYVLSGQQENGVIAPHGRNHGEMYHHGIATLLLSEVSGMTDPDRQERIDQALPAALKVILAAQQVNKSDRHAGGWRYSRGSRDSDISCTGWQLMALRSARGNGAQVPGASIDEAIDYLARLRTRDGGFAYQVGGGAGMARTGTGLLCLELLGRHGSEETTAAGDWLLKYLDSRRGLQPRESHFYYGLYYASQGMFQLGGKYWQRWGEEMYKVMLKTQRDDGSWPNARGGGSEYGRTYSTAMSVLALSVAYRQLPIYQR